jgi:hypothetical protein
MAPASVWLRSLLSKATQCGGCVLGRDNEGASIRGPGKDCTAGIGIKAATCRRGSCSVGAPGASSSIRCR